MNFYELNLDGLVGPSHHYAGLATGNIASAKNAYSIANPQQAALQGLKKMRLLHSLGIKQGVLPPHQRPNLPLLFQLGFTGEPRDQLRRAQKEDPHLLSACYSASSMWTANAATVSASIDAENHRLHFTPANLISHLHRHQEADFTSLLLKRIFANKKYFSHHAPLPGTDALSDEGAANHLRLVIHQNQPALNVFVFGRQGLNLNKMEKKPQYYSARQTKEASLAIARQHQLNPAKCVFVQQNPIAIDNGVFHNDVISTANGNVFLTHEEAFVNQTAFLETLQKKANNELHMIEIPSTRIPLADAIHSYLFNSQLITLPSDTDKKKMALIAPSECEENERIKSFITEVIEDESNPISDVYYLDLKQSMRNGGGPACLRLRVPMNENELSAMHSGVLINEPLLNKLEQWINQHYRTELHPEDLADPSLMDECFTALEALSSILNLGRIYPFQQDESV